MAQDRWNELLVQYASRKTRSRAHRYRNPISDTTSESDDDEQGVDEMPGYDGVGDHSSTSSASAEVEGVHPHEEIERNGAVSPSTEDDQMMGDGGSQNEMINSPLRDPNAHEESLSEDEGSDVESYVNSSPDSDTGTIEEDNLGYGFEKLRRFIAKEDNNQSMNLSVTVDKTELLLAILKFSLVNELTQTAVADLFKLISVVFGVDFLPTSRYLVDRLFNNDKGVDYHACCLGCKEYVCQFEKQTRSVRCTRCNGLIDLRSPTYRDFSVVIDVRNEIANLFENNWEAYQRNL
ncbi:hypothetical protein QAD02_002739 [Eretmocerus hayati]|uniref:Uncharacterized protein n=1 Tax=Eretmocerus hayati TaxID=131215 RepID=A0ACC2NJW3_9HYME|nr:hypothetical protein QAD02_002739 [Eretmocerus hayati]